MPSLRPHASQRTACVFALLLACLEFSALVAPVAARAAEPLFDVQEIAGEGRVVAAEIVDLDGDGASEVFSIWFVGFPPREQRVIRVYGAGPDGQIVVEPRFERVLPDPAAAYDFADISAAPGVELLLLQPQGIGVLSLASADAPLVELPVSGGRTLGAVVDERGIDRLRIAWPQLAAPGASPWLLVPMLGELVALATDGRELARFDVGARANYLIVPRPGPVVFESEIQLYLDVPRIEVGDVDGDDRADLIAATRHALRVFLRGSEGGFSQQPTRIVAIDRILPEDHLRGSGGLRTGARDLDGDGLLDLVLSHSRGGLANASFVTTVHLNRGGTWDLDKPDRRFENSSGWGTDEIVDLDGDGRPELVRVVIPVSVLELVEVLIQRAIDAEVSVYRADEAGGFSGEPWLERKFGVPISFQSGRPRGFVANVGADLDGDGARDLLASNGSDEIELFPFAGKRPYAKRTVSQSLDAEGRVRYGDFENDGFSDVLLYDPRALDRPLRVLRNRGGLTTPVVQ